MQNNDIFLDPNDNAAAAAAAFDAAEADDAQQVGYLENCPICMESLVIGPREKTVSVTRQCGHLFHEECIADWARQGTGTADGHGVLKCPTCNTINYDFPVRVNSERVDASSEPIHLQLKQRIRRMTLEMHELQQLAGREGLEAKLGRLREEREALSTLQLKLEVLFNISTQTTAGAAVRVSRDLLELLVDEQAEQFQITSRESARVTAELERMRTENELLGAQVRELTWSNQRMARNDKARAEQWQKEKGAVLQRQRQQQQQQRYQKLQQQQQQQQASSRESGTRRQRSPQPGSPGSGGGDVKMEFCVDVDDDDDNERRHNNNNNRRRRDDDDDDDDDDDPFVDDDSDVVCEIVEVSKGRDRNQRMRHGRVRRKAHLSRPEAQARKIQISEWVVEDQTRGARTPIASQQQQQQRKNFQDGDNNE